MSDEYRDRWITCTADGLEIRGYYFPWGTKRIPYATIRAVTPVRLQATRGRARIWGTANPRYWASLDPSRPSKQAGLVLDLGRSVSPLITPEDPDTVAAWIRESWRRPRAEPPIYHRGGARSWRCDHERRPSRTPPRSPSRSPDRRPRYGESIREPAA